MAFRGQTYQVPFSTGGLYTSRNYDAVPPESMVEPSKNINMYEGGRGKRGGTAHVNGTAVSGVNTLIGGFQFRLRSGTTFDMFVADNGSLYKNSTTTIKTGLSTTNRPSFEVMDNELFVCTGTTTPQTWDGSAAGTSNITTPAADWGTTKHPKYIIKHGRGASERMWFLGVEGHEESLYYSGNGTPKTANSGKVDIETGDGFGIVGGFEFGDRLFGVGKMKAYQIEDTDSSTANWGYDSVAWDGGAAHHWLIAKTPNDVIMMTEDGEIFSVTAAQTYGDYRAASLSRPSFIHNWIKDNVNLALVGQFHCAYDPVLRAVKFFVVRNGVTQVDTALVFFIDRPPDQAWMIHDNLTYVSGYGAASSWLVRKSVGVWKIYTGGYTGFMWELESSTQADNGNGYEAKFRNAPDPFGNARVQKRYRRGKLVFAPRGSYTVNVRWWVDGVQQTTRTVSTAGTGGTFGSGLFGTAVFGGQEITDAQFELGQIGKRFQYEIENSNSGEDFHASKLLVDHDILGPRAAT